MRTVARGGTYLCSRLAAISGRAIEQAASGAPRAAADALSARQREVLWLIAQGNSTRAIAEQMHLSVKTIETHRAQIMRRTGIDNVAGLTRYAMRMGLIPPER